MREQLERGGGTSPRNPRSNSLPRWFMTFALGLAFCSTLSYQTASSSSRPG